MTDVKTITLIADDQFDAILKKLAEKTHPTKSGVIRTAVLSYKEQLEREALRMKIKDASLRTRPQAKQAAEDFYIANSDGLSV
ncbi:MAG: ribbon-helix-helix protein, CopG family [bacterium]